MNHTHFHQIRTSQSEKAGDQPGGEGVFAFALTLIRRVITGRRYAIPDADMPDVAQETILRLWRWREKYQRKADEMTMAEWSFFTARVAHNEINRFSSSRLRAGEVPIDEASGTLIQTLDGNTDAEMGSVVANVWREICRLTLYQRRALLLSSPELLIYLIQFRIDEAEIITSLEVDGREWLTILERIPLSDLEIAAITRSPEKNDDSKSAARAIKKARFDARRKLGRLRK